jgi:protein-S-isoprenylcysteine O-methyltransferase Ste14
MAMAAEGAVAITWTGNWGDMGARSAPPLPAVKPLASAAPLVITHPQALHIIGDCWLIFVIFWLIAALNVKRTTERWSSATGISYFIASAVTYWLLVRTEFFGYALLLPHGPGPSFLAVLLGIAGLIVTLWARIVLGRNWSGSITHKEGHELVERGPYRFVRHPIYTGMLLMVVATAIARGTWDSVLGLILFTAVHIWKLRREEALMIRYFPDSYPEYRARTKALVPLLY